VAGLGVRPALALIDGFAVPALGFPGQAVVKGDRLVAAISAASILAKVTRDRLMSELHGEHPSYGFARHKGYSTPSHMKALAEHGPCPEHRRSFVNVGGLVRAKDVATVLAEEAEGAAAGDDPSSLAADPCSEPAGGQNGPIVDLAGEDAWSAASLASGARGA
jgi:ribonuclease HII